MIAHRRLLILVASAMTLMTASAWAATGAEVVKMLNRDSDQTLEIAEVIDAILAIWKWEGTPRLSWTWAGRLP